jgi:hypothetical protein
VVTHGECFGGSNDNNECKLWRKKSANEKTWPLFKTYFAAEYHDLKEQGKVNTLQNNFHAANKAVQNIDISGALET